MDIAKFIITGDMPIYEAASAINANERAIVFICDGGRVLASLSDGDIRRHVMANGDFSAPVKAIANYSVRCLPIERQAEGRSRGKRGIFKKKNFSLCGISLGTPI